VILISCQIDSRNQHWWLPYSDELVHSYYYKPAITLQTNAEEVSKKRLWYGITDIHEAPSSDYDVIANNDPCTTSLYVEEPQLVGINGPTKRLVGVVIGRE